jgi:hypothetical protein
MCLLSKRLRDELQVLSGAGLLESLLAWNEAFDGGRVGAREAASRCERAEFDDHQSGGTEAARAPRCESSATGLGTSDGEDPALTGPGPGTPIVPARRLGCTAGVLDTTYFVAASIVRAKGSVTSGIAPVRGGRNAAAINSRRSRSPAACPRAAVRRSPLGDRMTVRSLVRDRGFPGRAATSWRG